MRVTGVRSAKPGTIARGPEVPALYGLCTLLGAALLFLVEPMAAKGLLPVLGGAASVWTASLVFFQTVLLIGYGYAHALTRALSLRRAGLLHGAAVMVAVTLLPWHGFSFASWAGPVNTPPSCWVLGALASSIGGPFLVLSATGPLLQRWLAAIRADIDPFPYYAVSNAGSLAVLVAYPWVVERYLPLTAAPGDSLATTQVALWCGAFLVFAALSLTCAWTVVRLPQSSTSVSETRLAKSPASSRARWRECARWAGLSAAATSTMLAMTESLTTDVASVPLLWTLPLAIYLLTFVVAFGFPNRLPMQAISWAVAAGVLGIVACQWVNGALDPHVALPLYLGTLLAIGLLCHGHLVHHRPAAGDLTFFYLWIAAGGWLGSVACGLLAPMVFRDVAEFPLALALSCLARPGAHRRWRDIGLALAVAAAMTLMHVAFGRPPAERTFASAEVLVPCVACALLVVRPMAFAVGIGVLGAGAMAWSPIGGRALCTVRTFYGVLRVQDEPGPRFLPSGGPHAGQEIRFAMHRLYHGTTMHGIQVTREAERRLPTAYYHPSGPIGRVFDGLRKSPQAAGLAEVGVVGLGVGSLAAYAEHGEHFTFFEIDPAVVRIARDPALFTFVGDSAGKVDIVTADGRLALSATPEENFGLIVIDAFSSDAVPVHLLTRESLAMTLRKLRPGGVIAYHLSSRFFDLAPVLAEEAASLGKPGLFWSDEELSTVAAITGKWPSRWAVVANSRADLAAIEPSGPWVSLESQRRPHGGPWLWTDDYSSPLGVLK